MLHLLAVPQSITTPAHASAALHSIRHSSPAGHAMFVHEFLVGQLTTHTPFSQLVHGLGGCGGQVGGGGNIGHFPPLPPPPPAPPVPPAPPDAAAPALPPELTPAAPPTGLPL